MRIDTNSILRQSEVSGVEIIAKSRKIKPSHGRNWTGRHPVQYSSKPSRVNRRNQRFNSIPYESGLERDFLKLIDDAPGLCHVAAQPMMVAAYVNDRRVVYTPDFLVEFTDRPPSWLERFGFEAVTLVEVKPRAFCANELVLLKAALLGLCTGLPVVLINELDIRIHACEGR